MGMSLDATICIGAVVDTDEYSENRNIISEEILEDKYEGYISEYLYELLEDLSEVDIVGAGYEGRDTIVYLEGTITSTYYAAEAVDMDKLEDYKTKITNLKIILAKYNIKYQEIGVLLFPYYG